MDTSIQVATEYKKALIYCRVSSGQQVNDGHGLDSQEYRCIKFAEMNGWEVVKVFRDAGISGGLFERPKMDELIAYLDAHPKEKFVIIFDDLKRFARDVEVHWKLKRELVVKRQAIFKCPTFNFEDSPTGRAIETILASAAQLEREQNREQVIQRMKARMERGYWCLDYPPGYKFEKNPIHGKILVPDEPKATLIKQALEGYANNTLPEQVDVQKFLAERGFFHRKYSGKVHLEQVKRLLRRLLYAGYLENPEWGVTRRKAQHQALISLDTWQKIQDKLDGKMKIKSRPDIHKDFPLRGFLVCEKCGRPYTAAITTRYNKHKGKYSRAYYRKQSENKCDACNTQTHAPELHAEFERLLKKITPQPAILNLTKAVVEDVFNSQTTDEGALAKQAKKEIQTVEEEIKRLVGLIKKTESQAVIKSYEKEIEELSYKKEVLESKTKTQGAYPGLELGTVTDEVFAYLKNPLSIWKTNVFEEQRLVLNLVFSGRLTYSKKNGLGTPTLSLPYALFEVAQGQKDTMVEMAGVKPASRTFLSSHCSQD